MLPEKVWTWPEGVMTVNEQLVCTLGTVIFRASRGTRTDLERVNRSIMFQEWEM